MTSFLIDSKDMRGLSPAPSGYATLTASPVTPYSYSAGARSQSITATVSEPYSVAVTNEFGCSASSTVTKVTILLPPGQNVSTTADGVTTTFAELTGRGPATVTAITSAEAPTLPVGYFQLRQTGVAYDIATGAV